jgi:hypothetical protein
VNAPGTPASRRVYLRESPRTTVSDDAPVPLGPVLLAAGSAGIAAWLAAYWTAGDLAAALGPGLAFSAGAVVVWASGASVDACRRLVAACLAANLVAAAALFVYGVGLGRIGPDPLGDPVVVAVVVAGQTAFAVGALTLATLGVRALRAR